MKVALALLAAVLAGALAAPGLYQEAVEAYRGALAMGLDEQRLRPDALRAALEAVVR